MPETNIGSTIIGNLANTQANFSVDSVETDGAQEQKETSYMNNEWSQQFGYYKTIPELRASIDALARWTIGKGFNTNELTELALMNIKGFGKDSFNTILENLSRTADISGDSYAEIIRDKQEFLINLKPLDPGTISIVANRKGVIIRYEQNSKASTKKKPKKFKPEQIFHLSRNRTADEIHGISLIDAVRWIIDARNEAMEDMKILMHRHVKPINKFILDTDDPARIAEFKARADAAVAGGENMFIPKGVVEQELISVPPNASLNPLPWIGVLTQYFYQAAGVPQSVIGGSQGITEAAEKIHYLAFEQTIRERQLYINEQVLSQLNLEIELEVPASLENELISDQSKSETVQASTPEDTAVNNAPVSQRGIA